MKAKKINGTHDGYDLVEVNETVVGEILEFLFITQRNFLATADAETAIYHLNLRLRKWRERLYLPTEAVEPVVVGPLSPAQRRARIAHLLGESPDWTTAALAVKLGVSQETVRSDRKRLVPA